MNNILKGVALVLVGAVVGLVLAGSFDTKEVATKEVAAGGVYSQSEQSFGKGLRAEDVTVTSDIVSTKTGLCFNFYATSTATVGKMTASTTATVEGVDGVMMFEYGSCQS